MLVLGHCILAHHVHPGQASSCRLLLPLLLPLPLLDLTPPNLTPSLHPCLLGHENQ
jgi:hypothetical protein